MKQIYIKTTESCQLRCKHCYIGDFRNKKVLFNEVDTVKWLKNYFSLTNTDEKDVLISFHGGEPFMCPLPKLKYVTNALNCTFNATTNLVFPLDRNKIDFITTKFIDPMIKKPYIKTSWDVNIRFLNLAQRRQWEENIKLLKENNVVVHVIVCLTNHTLNINPLKLYRYMEDLGVDILSFERLTENTTSNKELIPNYKDQDDWLYKAYLFSKNETK